MNRKLHADQRNAVDPLREVGPLYDKLVYWLYERQDVRRAQPFADKLELLLKDPKVKTGSIFAEDCQSLVHEARGNLAKAIKHRLQAIRLIRRLHRLSQDSAQADFVFRQYSYADLRDELESLAILYHDIGDLNRAISTLQASEQLCRDHRLKSAAGDLLKDYLEESRGISEQAE
jgi:tetratricopeptide (TPR) repeat protein